MTEVSSLPPTKAMAALFAPKTVAVVGASTNKVTYGNIFIRRLRKFGFEGDIYPIHPSAENVEGLQAYSSFKDTPEAVDYAYVAVPPAKVSDVLVDAGSKLRFAHVISSGFGEVEAGKPLEAKLVETARRTGIRVLGPNCIGLHSPRGRVTFTDPAQLSREVGSVAIISQSGGLATDAVRSGTVRGLKFSGAVSVGNSADIGPNELLEFFLEDSLTEVIGIYLEDVKDGRRFFELLRNSGAKKPVVLLIGGRTQQGQRAAASHTGALAQDDRVWVSLARQTGAVLVETLEEFIEALFIFQMLHPRSEAPTQEVVLFGNGGGISVLATDFFGQLGLSISPFDDTARQKLEQLELPPGSSAANPIDTPLGTLRVDDGRIAGRIVDLVLTAASPDAVVMHLNLPGIVPFADEIGADLLGNLMRSALDAVSANQKKVHFLLVLRSNGHPNIESRKLTERQRAAEMGIPVFDEYTNAAKALAAMKTYETSRQLFGDNQKAEVNK